MAKLCPKAVLEGRGLAHKTDVALDGHPRVLELDVSDDDVDGAVERVANWLEETDGLTLPGGL